MVLPNEGWIGVSAPALRDLIARADSALVDGEDAGKVLRDVRESLDAMLATAAMVTTDPLPNVGEREWPPRNYALEETASIYVEPAERYVVSLIVGYQDVATEQGGVDGPEGAARGALDLTRDDGSLGTRWFVYDRARRQMRTFEQRDFDPEWGDD